MKTDALECKLHKLGLGVSNRRNVWIYLDGLWDAPAIRYRKIDDELIDHIMGSSEFDYDLFCVLAYYFGMNTRDALEICLS